MNIKLQELLLECDEPPGNSPQWNDWRWQLKNAVSKIEDLSKIFLLDKEELKGLKRVIAKYPFSITPYYLSLIDKKNLKDPIRLQCLPSPDEATQHSEVEDDPLGEEGDTVMPGLVHRYPDRVLVTLTNMCPVYCRHCTRKREWCKMRWVRRPEELAEIYRYISLHKKIRDVIISGGEPLILSTARIESVLINLRNIPHVEIIRIGTRCPVVLPQRIDDELVTMLKKCRPLWLNTHFNHPNEITKESAEACDKILCAGIPMNNQTVLLKSINDSVEVVTKLCQTLLKIGVRPYYLFQCDPVSGTAHLRTPVEKGLEIIKGMRGFTSGLSVPTFVVDGPKGQGKVPLQPDYMAGREGGNILLKGYRGEVFAYHNPAA